MLIDIKYYLKNYSDKILLQLMKQYKHLVSIIRKYFPPRQEIRFFFVPKSFVLPLETKSLSVREENHLSSIDKAMLGRTCYANTPVRKNLP